MKIIEHTTEHIYNEIESVLSNTIGLTDEEYNLLAGQLTHLFVDLMIEEHTENGNDKRKSFYIKLKKHLAEYISQYY